MLSENNVENMRNSKESPKENKKEGIYTPVEQVELSVDYQEKKDNSYLRHISSDYFESERKRIFNKEGIDEDERLYEGFLEDSQKKIEALTYLSKEQIEKDEQKLWKETAPALSELMKRMTNSRDELLYNPDTQLFDINKEFKDYETAKKIFMSVCNKLNPEEKINLDASTFRSETERLKKLNFMNARGSISEIRELLQEKNPRKMIEIIDLNQSDFAGEIRFSAIQGFSRETNDIQDGILREKIQGVPNSVYSLYRLELMRDELVKKNYGASMNLIDQKKVDDIKTSFILNETKDNLLEQKESSPNIFEDISEDNFEKYLKQNKTIFFDGFVYNIETNNKGDFFISRPISIKEALKVARGATKDNNVNTGMIKTRMSSIPKELLFTEAKWVIKNPVRKSEDPKRLEDINEVKELQRILTATNEFNNNIGGSFQLLNDVFLREVERLNKEKEEFENVNNIK